jgi:hypothetical protein
LTHFLEFRAPAAGALLNRVDHLVEGWPAEAAKAREKRRVSLGQLDAYRERVGLPFEQEDRLEALHGLRSELETLLSSPPEEGARERIDAAVAAFQTMRDAPDLPPAPTPEAEPPHHAPHRVPHEEADALDTPAIVVPFPLAEAGPLPTPETPSAPPAWTARVRENGRPARQASLFDQPRPVAAEPVRRTDIDGSWRKAVSGKPT